MLVEEDLGGLAELVGILGGEIFHAASLGTTGLHFGMTLEIILKAFCHILALRDYSHTRTDIFHYLRHQQRIVRTTKNDGIYGRVETHELVDALLYKIVGSRTVCLVILNQGNPKRACHARDLNIGIEFLYLKPVAVAAYSSLCGKNSNMTRGGELTYDLGSGANDAKHTARGVEFGKVNLLYRPKSLCRSRVAAKDDEIATQLKQTYNSLTCELINNIERTRTVRRTGIVAEIHIVVLRQKASDTVENGQAAIARIKNAYRSCFQCL